MFNGLSTVNIELTSLCNKSCFFCGRRKIERDYPQLAEWGDMDFRLVQRLAKELPKSIVIQFHNNGEPLLYLRLREALDLFPNRIKCLDTNGKLLLEKAGEIIDHLDTLTLSVFEKDPEGLDQYLILRAFMLLKGNRKPLVVSRILGQVPAERYKKLGCIIAKRILHSPVGSFDYIKKPTIPEIGICLDLLHHLVINRDGTVSPCVRFDPERKGIIGDLKDETLAEIWAGKKRQAIIDAHLTGNRARIALCERCQYWGVPRG